MHALIEKDTNKILKVENTFVELSELKPMYWINCPENCNTSWTFDGSSFLNQSVDSVIENPQDIINENAKRYLYETDWYVIRFVETGNPIPIEILAEREKARRSIV